MGVRGECFIGVELWNMWFISHNSQRRTNRSNLPKALCTNLSCYEIGVKFDIFLSQAGYFKLYWSVLYNIPCKELRLERRSLIMSIIHSFPQKKSPQVMQNKLYDHTGIKHIYKLELSSNSYAEGYFSQQKQLGNFNLS